MELGTICAQQKLPPTGTPFTTIVTGKSSSAAILRPDVPCSRIRIASSRLNTRLGLPRVVLFAHAAFPRLLPFMI
jgi:hypothetical protein